MLVFKSRDGRIVKFNPYHGKDGRFTSANGAISFTIASNKPFMDKALQRAKEKEKQRTSDKHIVHGVDVGSILPDPIDIKYLDVGQLPKLKGTEKQVKWAEDIRSKIGDDVLQTYYSKYVSKNNGGFDALTTSKKAMVDNIKKNPLVQSVVEGGNQKVVEEKITNAANHFREMGDSLSKINDLLGKDESKFWIDNRDKVSKIKREIFGENFL
jgi:hypothetical protein